MKTGTILIFLAVAAFAAATPLHAQQRKDVIWARNTTPGAITLNGVLSEPAWATAESLTIQWAVDAGVPGSGWKPEGGGLPTNPTNAKIKFLRDGNLLYMAAIVEDNSIGGSELFNRFDGFLMGIQDHTVLGRPTIPMEHFYSWWWPNDATPRAVGKQPSFIGAWGNNPPTVTRTAEQIANWDAVTVVTGTTNDDAAADTRYVVEMKFNVGADGYNYTDGDGDIVEFNMSIYDCDAFWPIVASFASNRVWLQGPWGNVSHYHEMKIHGRNDVTTASGAVPIVGPDMRVRNGANHPAPTIDGLLNETVWQQAPSFDIRYGDDALRATYPAVGPFRSGQYQPPVNGGTAAVLDPGDATVKMFFRGDRLYLGFDVRDQVVQRGPDFDRLDGFLVNLNEKTLRASDNNIQGRRIGWHVDNGGTVGTSIEENFLPYLRDTVGGLQIALQLKAGTTIDTVGLDVDAGYTAEMWIDLTKLGYPPGLGDGIVWLGLNLLDSDSFVPFTDSYGTRTWWFREYQATACPAWLYLDPALPVVGVGDPFPSGPNRTQLLGNSPNPFGTNTTVRYALASPAKVSYEVYDLGGRRVAGRELGLQAAGNGHFVFSREGLGSGLYLYRVRLADPVTGALRETLSGRMMVVR